VMVSPSEMPPKDQLTESPPTSAFDTTPIDLFPRPPTADRRAASPRVRVASAPTQQPWSPNLAPRQSEPPTLEDFVSPSPATRSRAYPNSVSLRRGFVPLSRGDKFATAMSRTPFCDCSGGRATGTEAHTLALVFVRLTSAQLFSMIPQGCRRAPRC
jgi:hypothetical protein